MISVTAEYALRAVAYLAGHNEMPRTVHEISEVTQVPMDYLSKVLQELARVGIVRSQWGLHGGFSLRSDPKEASVYDIVHSLSPIERITECPLGFRHRNGKLCRLHQLLDDVAAYVEGVFRGVTLAELADPETGGTAPWTSKRQPQRSRRST